MNEDRVKRKRRLTRERVQRWRNKQSQETLEKLREQNKEMRKRARASARIQSDTTEQSYESNDEHLQLQQLSELGTAEYQNQVIPDEFIDSDESQVAEPSHNSMNIVSQFCNSRNFGAERSTYSKFNSYYHKDCFDEVDLNEMRYYQSMYPKLEAVTEKRVHCTSCDKHIGTAPVNETNVFMHSVLRVTQCIECYNFYNSGNFDTDEDGSELYCRWCGQGGEVYCCTKCPYVFCHKCIALNLSPSCATDIENNENWICFACSPKMLMDLRAQHWALVNYMEKQREKIETLTKDDFELEFLMNKDLSKCCGKRKSDVCTSQSATMKRKKSEEDVSELPKTKKIITQQEVNQVMASTKAIKKEVDDIEIATPSPKPIQIVQVAKELTSLHPIQSQMTARQPVATPVIRPTLTPTLTTLRPVYHTINGCRYNLSKIGQQTRFRLPDGKIIQVVKQTQNQQVGSSQIPRISVIRPANIRVKKLVTVPTQSQPTSIKNPIHNNIPSLNPTHLFTVRNVQPNTSFDTHRAQLESRVKNGIMVCQQIINKINKFTNTTIYSDAKNIQNIRDLNVNFMCLVTNAVGSFKSLQERCSEDLNKLVSATVTKPIQIKRKVIVKQKPTVTSQSSSKIDIVKNRNSVDKNDDDVSIVEPLKSIITVESDNEENEENDDEKVINNIKKFQEEFLGKWVDDSSQKTPVDVNNQTGIVKDEKSIVESPVPGVVETNKEDQSQNYDSHGVDIKMEFEEEIEQINEILDESVNQNEFTDDELESKYS